MKGKGEKKANGGAGVKALCMVLNGAHFFSSSEDLGNCSETHFNGERLFVQEFLHIYFHENY